MWALFGFVLSAAWLGAVYWWFREHYGLENIEFMLPGEMGQTLAGIVAPLALIWILVAYIRNGSSLSRVSDELADLREAVRQRQAAAAREPSQRLAAAERPVPPVAATVPARSLPPAPTPAPALSPAPLTPSPAPAPQPAVLQPVVQPVPPPAASPVPPLTPLRPVAPPIERIPAPVLTPSGPTPSGPTPSGLTPLSLGSSPDTEMLPPRSPGAPPERSDDSATIGALAQEVARNLERLEAGKPPQPSPAVAAVAVPDVPTELEPELQQQLHRVARDLNAISMDLSAVLCRKSARDDALKAYNRGQKESFHQLVREYLSRHEPAEIVSRLAQADATSLLHTYAMKFSSLVDEAKRHDASGGQEALLRQSALGQLYGEVLRHTAAARGPLRT